MGTVGLTIKVMPSGVEVDRKELRKAIEKALDKKAKIVRIFEQPIAFGLVALMVQVTMDDAHGNPDALEETLEAIEDVESVTVEEVGLL